MSNQCPQCGRANRAGARFCAECGGPLATVDATATLAPGNALEAGDAPVAGDAPATGEAPPALDAALAGDATAAPAEDGVTASAAESAPAPVSAPASAAGEALADAAAAHLSPGDGAGLDVAAQDGAAQDGAAQDVGALGVGALIAGRYFVLDILAGPPDAAGQPLYLVQDRGVCRACGLEVSPADDEPYCPNCGAQLQLLALPWPLSRLQEVAPDVASDAGPDNALDGVPGLAGATHIAWQGRAFAVIPGGADCCAEEQDSAGEPAQAAHTPGADLLPAGAPWLRVGQRSDVGDARAGRTNEDSLLTLTLTAVADSQPSPSLGLYVVADGMGGHLDGEVASRTACTVIGAELVQSLGLPALQGTLPDDDASFEAISQAINQAIQNANRQIRNLAGSRSSNMGTTVVLAFVINERVCVANVGDSRAYRWGREGLRQVTEDHSHVYTLRKKGLLTEDELYTHPRRNEIYRSLGFTDHVEVDCFQERLEPGDLLLLCSDGLWEMLRSEGIADVLLLNLDDPQAICDELVNRANLAGGDDNISVVIVQAAG